MTRRGLLSTFLCSLIGLAMWWGLVTLGCRVAR